MYWPKHNYFFYTVKGILIDGINGRPIIIEGSHNGEFYDWIIPIKSNYTNMDFVLDYHVLCKYGIGVLKYSLFDTIWRTTLEYQNDLLEFSNLNQTT